MVPGKCKINVWRPGPMEKLLIEPIILEAAGVLKHNSSCCKRFRKALMQSLKIFRTSLIPIKKGFWKPLELAIFCRFLYEVSTGFCKPVDMVTSSFRKLFYHCSCGFQENQQAVVRFFFIEAVSKSFLNISASTMLKNEKITRNPL